MEGDRYRVGPEVISECTILLARRYQGQSNPENDDKSLTLTKNAAARRQKAFNVVDYKSLTGNNLSPVNEDKGQSVTLHLHRLDGR